MNRLYYGDCLTIMRDFMKLGSVDLIYLDPPFNSNRDYNNIYKDETGRPLPDQVEGFNDMWRDLSPEREEVLRAMPVLMRESGVDDKAAEFWRLWMQALRKLQPHLLSYLLYMTERLLPMRGILKPTGSIYLHCDPTASHYIKVMMDAIFGHTNFASEIIWRRAQVKGDSRRKFAANHDAILVYKNGRDFRFNPVYGEKGHDYKARFDRDDKDGRGPYHSAPLDSPSPRPNLTYKYKGYSPPANGWRVSREEMDRLDHEGRLILPAKKTQRIRRKLYISEAPGPMIGDVWTDILSLQSGAERIGYATQKPLTLLERIIAASTDPKDVVFDPFCGCATTLEAAHRLGRKWIGIDRTIHAIKRVASIRLRDRLGLVDGTDFEILGAPNNLEGAQDLWKRDPFDFQQWAIESVEGFATTKRTGDGGIDGRLYFDMPGEQDFQSMAIEVKGGKNVGIGAVRELAGVLDNDDALIAGLIILEPLGDRKLANFRTFMAQAGDLDVRGIKYAKMQILTAEEILSGKRFVTPGPVGRSLIAPSLPLG